MDRSVGSVGSVGDGIDVIDVMRLRRGFPFVGIAVVLGGAIVLASCAHDDRKPTSIPTTEPTQTTPSFNPPQYLVADPTQKAGAIAIPLGGPGLHGLVVDKRRVIIGHGEPRVAADVTPDPIAGATKLPGRFGNGFLFWTASTLYRSDAFDAKLTPLARLPDPIETISMTPKSILIRTKNGERWGLGLPNGERAGVQPLGVADVQSLDDGRALAFNDQGAVFTSTDHGAHWTDATTQVKSSPNKVTIVGGDVWLYESNSGASRLEPDGHLAWFDKAPPDAPPELRTKDPRWRGNDTPLRAVFHTGAAIDDSSAIVLDSGDVVRVDVHTGEILSVVPGRLPPDAQCEAVPVTGDVLFACMSRTSNGTAFVVAHTLSSESPTVEQSFVGGAQFFASDDGGLAYGASCQGASGASPNTSATTPTVCVRTPGGRWEEHDVSSLVTDGGTAGSSSDVNVARWIPRADGRVAAIVIEPVFGIYDPLSAVFTPIADEAKDVVGRGAPHMPSLGGRVPKLRFKKGFSGSSGVVDPSWSFGSGSTLRGWQRHGESVEISEDGKLTRSPFAFDVIFAGATGLGRSKDGRLYQSNDHGSTWSEVATPPTGVESNDLVSCTSAGCDLGAFYRVGWQLRPPRVEPVKASAPPAPEVRRTRGLELSCKPTGGVASKVLPRQGDSPEDLGLGMSRLPVANDKNEWAYVRNLMPRGIATPSFHDSSGNDGDGSPALRALLSGFGTSHDGDVITVSGPNKSAMALRRGVSYVAPFDPVGRVVRTSIAMSEVVAAARRTGMTTDEILAEDFTETGTAITLASSDPFAPSDIAIHNSDHGLLSIIRGERVRVAVRTNQNNNANVLSGVFLPQDEAAFLEVDSSGVGHVFKVSPGGVISDLFDISPTASETYYPANPDALAVDAKGSLAILRTPSGSDPASALDPAFLIIPAMPPTALAPWSELKLSDDPACKSDPQSGHRGVIQIIAPWVRISTPELRVEPDAPMIARVRWSPKRVCLEGFEVKLPSISMRLQGASGNESATFSSWLVARGSSFARVSVAEGLEWRQALECSISSTGP
jgi:hypothetical protein